MKKYAIISNKKRNQLIKRVVLNGQSVIGVAKQLRMKIPSAKSIIRTFKKSGKIFDKKRHQNNQLSDTDQHKDNSEHKQTTSISGLKVEYVKQNDEIALSEQKQRINGDNINKMNIFYQQMSYYQQIYFQQQYINYVNMLKYLTQN